MQSGHHTFMQPFASQKKYFIPKKLQAKQENKTEKKNFTLGKKTIPKQKKTNLHLRTISLLVLCFLSKNHGHLTGTTCTTSVEVYLAIALEPAGWKKRWSHDGVFTPGSRPPGLAVPEKGQPLWPPKWPAARGSDRFRWEWCSLGTSLWHFVGMVKW